MKTGTEQEKARLFPLGNYELRVSIMAMLTIVPAGMNLMSVVFVLHAPEYHCDDEIIKMNNFTISSDDQCTFTLNNTGNLHECQSWTFDNERQGSTIASEFDIVCANALKKPLLTSLYLVGIMVGSFIGGPLSDRFGRRRVLLCSLFIEAAAQLSTAIAPSVEIFAIPYFICGVFGIVQYMAGNMLVVETLSSSAHSFGLGIYAMGFSIGYMILPGMAYLVPKWRFMLMVVGIMRACAIPVVIWGLPESPLWLIAIGRDDEAIVTLRNVYEVEDDSEIEEFLTSKPKKEDTRVTVKIILTLFTERVFLWRSLVMYCVWITISMAYFAISLNTSNMGGNRYVNCFIAAAVEVPAVFGFLWLVEKFGRRVILSSSLFFIGIICSTAPILKLIADIVLTVMAMLSKFVVAGLFIVIYLYVPELFPTLLRTSSLGMSSFAARIGSIVAPFLVYAGENINKSIPYVVIGAFCVFTSMLLLLLPETKGIPLANTTEEAIALDRYKLKFEFLKSNKRNIDDEETKKDDTV